MGVDFNCGDFSRACSNSTWYDFRCDAIQATYDYIEDKYKKDKELFGHLTEDEEGWIGEGSNYHSYISIFLEYKKICTVRSNSIIIDHVNEFVHVCYNYHYMNALNFFGVGGLFSLCNQSDCEGYYTPGNSLDICSLLDKIKPFFTKYNTYRLAYAEDYETVYEVFDHSYKTLHNVTIC